MDIAEDVVKEDKVKEIKLAQKVGFNLCSGGIIGMDETWAYKAWL